MSYVNQMKKSDANISSIVQDIATADIVPPSLPTTADGPSTLDLSEFFDLLEAHRAEQAY